MSSSEPAAVSTPAVQAPMLSREQPTIDPRRSLGIVGFVLSFFAVANIAGLIISIIALVGSKRAGFRNRFALAGTVISGIGVLVSVIVVISVVSALVGAAQTCAQLGEGVHVVGQATYTCTPTSFYVVYGSQR